MRIPTIPYGGAVEVLTRARLRTAGFVLQAAIESNPDARACRWR
jgi:hypothetical protein